MNSNNKKEITINEKFYTISSELLGETWKILLTNINDLFIEKLSCQEIIERCERLNPLLSIEDIDVGEIIRELFNDIPKYTVEIPSLEKIKLQTTIEGGIFKFIINLKRADNEEFQQEILQPITSYIIELQQKFNDLIDEVKKKDEEILEYKSNGAKLIRKHIETEPFNVNSWIPDSFEENKKFLSMCQLIPGGKNLDVQSNDREIEKKINTRSKPSEKSEFDCVERKKRKIPERNS